MPKQTFTAREAMEALGISRNSLYRLVKTGRLHSVRCGRKILVPRWAVQRFLSGRID